MKTLKTIQVLAKIGKIVSKVLFIFCLVGAGGCLLGILGMALGASAVRLGGLTLESILQTEAETSLGSVYASLAVGLIFCAMEAVLAKFAEHYFNRELNDGTPFTLGGAKELLRLGILAIAIPTGTQILSGIVYGIFAATMQDVAPMEIGTYGSVGVGVMMIVMALICRYGAELFEGAQQPEQPQLPDQA